MFIDLATSCTTQHVDVISCRKGKHLHRQRRDRTTTDSLTFSSKTFEKSKKSHTLIKSWQIISKVRWKSSKGLQRRQLWQQRVGRNSSILHWTHVSKIVFTDPKKKGRNTASHDQYGGDGAYDLWGGHELRRGLELVASSGQTVPSSCRG